MSEQNEYLDKKVAEFVHTHGVACGGNWASMYMWAIRNGMPDVYASLEDHRSYNEIELYRIIETELEARKEVV